MYLFTSNDASRILRNTVCYNLMFMLVGTVCAIAVALMLEKLTSRRCIKLYQTFIFLPYFVSWVVVSYMTSGLFSYDGGVDFSAFESHKMAFAAEKSKSSNSVQLL